MVKTLGLSLVRAILSKEVSGFDMYTHMCDTHICNYVYVYVCLGFLLQFKPFLRSLYP